MYSPHDNRCSHRLGSPIRKSPDHRLIAPSRGLSQLATSFIAYLCQGIHTHALSSLTIKFTLNTEQICATTLPHYLLLLLCGNGATFVVSCPSIFNCQRSLLSPLLTKQRNKTCWWAWVDSNYRPHPYQGCALAT